MPKQTLPEQFPFAGTTVTVVYSKRRSLGLQIQNDGTLVLRLPVRTPDKLALEFLSSKESWVRSHLKQMEAQVKALDEAGFQPLTSEELSALTERARVHLTARTEYFAPIVGVTYGRIAIRHQKTRWGSCSAKGNLNYNCLLMLCPPEVQDYVVVHELCHRKQMNHSPAFWAEVEAVLPDYRQREQWLKENGASLQRLIGN